MASPSKTFNVKGINVAIWEGDRGRSISIKKSYKDKNTGAYKEAKTYFENELSTLISLLNEARDYLGVAETPKQTRRTEPLTEDVTYIMPEPQVRSLVEPTFNDDDIPF